MFHAGYGLLEVKEWGRWKSSCFHGYLWYDMHTMRGVGENMAIATGLFGFTKMKPTVPKAATFRIGGKKKKDGSTQPQSSFPDTRNLPPVEITELLAQDIRSAVHLWQLLDSPEHTDPEDLRWFNNQNAVCYARQGRKFSSELLALGNFKQARNSQRSWECSQTRIAGFSSSETEFNRLHQELAKLHKPVKIEPVPFVANPPYVPATERDYELMRKIRRERDRENEEEENRNRWEAFNRYGTNDWIEIAEMYASDPNPGIPLGEMDSESQTFWRKVRWECPKKSKIVLRGGPGIASPRTPRISTEHVEACDGSSADQPLPGKPLVKQLKMSSPSSGRESETHEFRAGGKRREDKEDDTDSHDAGPLSESELFPSPRGSTFSTAATDAPDFNPTFDTTIEYSHHEMVSDGQSAMTRTCGVSSTPIHHEVEDGVRAMRERSHMGSVFSADNGTVIDGETSYASNWNSRQSSNPWLSQDASQENQPPLPRRDYRRNLRQSPNVTPIPQMRRMKEGGSSICSPYPRTPRSLMNFESGLPEQRAQGKGSKDSIHRRRCGKNGQYIKEERPTTWSYATDPRSDGMPPPERTVRPRNRANGDPNLGRRETPLPIENATSFHPVLPLPEHDAQPTTALSPYQPVGGTGNAPCLRRPRRLTPGENFRLMSSVNENVRKRAERTSQRNEARALWMRLRFPTPEDPFGPTEGFSDDAIRLATLGCTFLELSEEIGNSSARHQLHAEMMRLRSVYRIFFCYMHHWAEYRDAYESYVNQIREFFPPEGH